MTVGWHMFARTAQPDMRQRAERLLADLAADQADPTACVAHVVLALGDMERLGRMQGYAEILAEVLWEREVWRGLASATPDARQAGVGALGGMLPILQGALASVRQAVHARFLLGGPDDR